MTPEALAPYILTAMQAWVPEKDHAYYETADATRARYAAIADDIAQVVTRTETLPWEGDEGQKRAALTLVAIGSNESHWKASVVSCAEGGDRERIVDRKTGEVTLGEPKAWGAFQSHSNKPTTCASLRNAATIALRIIAHGQDRCSRWPEADRLSWYTDGRCVAGWKRSRRIADRVRVYSARHTD